MKHKAHEDHKDAARFGFVSLVPFVAVDAPAPGTTRLDLG
jgi:hypothetical protein